MKQPLTEQQKVERNKYMRTRRKKPEQRAKISDRQRKRHRTPEQQARYRANRRKYNKKPEVIARRKARHTPEFRAMERERLKIKLLDPIFKAKYLERNRIVQRRYHTKKRELLKRLLAAVELHNIPY